MAQFHSAWLEDAIDAYISGKTFNLGIVTDTSINPDTALYSGLTAVGTATGWTGPVALSNFLASISGGNVVIDADDPSQIAQDGSGFSNARSLVIYETVSSEVLWSHEEVSTFGNVSGPLTISFHANGILQVTI